MEDVKVIWYKRDANRSYYSLIQGAQVGSSAGILKDWSTGAEKVGAVYVLQLGHSGVPMGVRERV